MSNERFDTRIPIALVMTIVLQSAAIAYWGGRLSQRVDFVERQVLIHDADRERLIMAETRSARNTDAIAINAQTLATAMDLLREMQSQIQQELRGR